MVDSAGSVGRLKLKVLFFARRAGRKVRGKAKPGGNGGRTRKGREEEVGGGGGTLGGEDGDDYEGGREEGM